MKIAIIRGPSWTPWEQQSFEPLCNTDQLTAFVSASYPHPTSSKSKILRRELPSSDRWAVPAGPALQRLWNGFTSRVAGFSHSLKGLVGALDGFDILHSLETYSTISYQAMKAKERYGSKLVLTVWETLAHRGQSHPLRKIRKRRVMECADAFIAVTTRTAAMLETEGADPEKIHVIPMGLDLDKFQQAVPDAELRQSWGAGPEDWVILCIARMVPEKGPFDLLNAIQRLIQLSGSSRIRLVWAGDGPLRRPMEQWVKQRSLSSCITFPGAYPYERVPTLLASAQCFVLPSVPFDFWEEQFGYVLIEAMATGIPVVTTRCGAIPLVVGDAARLVSPGDVDALATELQRLRVHPDIVHANVRRGRQLAAERYDHRRVAAQLRELYTRVQR